jgi:transcription-repair coupling factor (superfamily II helicase)
MNLDVLQNYFKNDPRCFQIANRITMSEPQHLLLNRLDGSQISFLFNAVFTHDLLSQSNHLIVLRDAEEAAYFQNTLVM